jgi:hypothetical protein
MREKFSAASSSFLAFASRSLRPGDLWRRTSSKKIGDKGKVRAAKGCREIRAPSKIPFLQRDEIPPGKAPRNIFMEMK